MGKSPREIRRRLIETLGFKGKMRGCEGCGALEMGAL